MGCIGFGMHVHMKRTEEKNPMCISKRKIANSMKIPQLQPQWGTYA
jgi:hypothetical protein